ncbi:MAG: alpha/beta hydrolase [Cyanobacteria bacterium P01_C01_bin.69]
MKIPFARHTRKLAVALSLIAGSSIVVPATVAPVRAAERIQFFVGPFEPTIYVDDLETFADTGEIPDRLKPIVNRFNDEQKERLQVLLNAQYELSPIPVAQFTYSTLGENLLEKLGQVVQTDSFLNGMKGMRAALILAADDESQGGLTVLNVMRHFPLQTIQIDFSLVREIVVENEQIFMRRDNVVSEIEQFAQTQSVQYQAIGGVAPDTDSDPRQAGDHTWQVETISFQTPGRSEASLADIYLPDAVLESADELAENVSDQNTPVVVISHGVASTRNTLAYMAEHLASHGYAVIAIEHTETSAEKFSRFLWGKERAPGGQELLLRPRDITAVLDHLSDRRATGDLALSGLNLTSVGLLGQSLGGYTVLAAGGAAIDQAFLAEACQSSLAERPTLNLSMLTQCTLLELPPDTPMAVADERVAAVVALNPLTSSIFGMSGLQEIEIPVMMMAGSDDYVAPALPEQIEPFDWLTTEHKKLVVMEKGTHFSFLDRNSRSVLPFSDQLTGPDPMAAREPTRALGLSFFNRHLQRQAEAEQFLTQSYLDGFPKEPFEFSVVDSLPPAAQ